MSAWSSSHGSRSRACLLGDDFRVAFADIAETARRAQRFLHQAGIGRAEPVAIVAEPSPPCVAAVLALILLGVPFAPIHHRLPIAARERAAKACGAARWITPDQIFDTEPVSAALPSVPCDERPCAVIHTSGSTAEPRGVVLSRRAFAASAQASAANLGWREDDRWLLSLPLAHIGGLSVLTRCLIGRRPVVLPSGSATEAIAEAVTRHRVTILSLVPTRLRQLLDQGRDPHALRAVLVGGAGADSDLIVAARRRGWPVLATYGMTETCSQVSTQSLQDLQRGLAVGVGRALRGIGVRIDADGSIQVRGSTLFSGYADGAPGAFTGDGWLDTRDLGEMDESGYLTVLGRRDSTIVTGGEKVLPQEVEQVLERHPGVRRACVFGIDDRMWGQLVCAALTTENEFDLEDLAAYVGQELPSFQRPRLVALVTELPIGSSGKLDRPRISRLVANELVPIAHGEQLSGAR